MSDLWFLITLPFRALQFILKAIIDLLADDADEIH